ncbi:1-phosphofructokinase family hexose kinase [Nocardioides piscis]|uniref:1-phosphofructokinase family hexose kinase n=1 Tax=Nocardioides piscis TaxID=2714938 RepID=A0A6G7YJK9_9ACTN|nr:1-phosphofructokinase family hexose kinase [Nocardioides piscis]QIK76933.1 1-phosphofructokinase family hexose kinase [Nocardioides piscis]
MILTLTPNPSIDRTITLAGELTRGQVQRVVSVTSQGGGKGVNISRASVSAGEPTVAVLPAAKDDPFVIELLAAGIDCRPVRPAGDVRVNITITEPDGTTTKLNSPGASVEAVHLEAMASTLLARAPGASWTVLAGSLPAGAPPEFYAELVRRLHATGAKVAVDTSDAPLRALVDALPDSAPDLMKPNGDELASFTGADAVQLEANPAQAAEAARTLVRRGVGAVLATLGGNGAVLVTADGAWHATPPPTTVVSTVAAGDSSLFGYLLGDIRGLSAPDRLALAVAYGSAAAGLPGTTIPEPAHLRTDLVTVTVLGGSA